MRGRRREIGGRGPRAGARDPGRVAALLRRGLGRTVRRAP